MNTTASAKTKWGVRAHKWFWCGQFHILQQKKKFPSPKIFFYPPIFPKVRKKMNTTASKKLASEMSDVKSTLMLHFLLYITFSKVVGELSFFEKNFFFPHRKNIFQKNAGSPTTLKKDEYDRFKPFCVDEPAFFCWSGRIHLFSKYWTNPHVLKFFFFFPLRKNFFLPPIFPEAPKKKFSKNAGSST